MADRMARAKEHYEKHVYRFVLSINWATNNVVYFSATTEDAEKLGKLLTEHNVKVEEYYPDDWEFLGWTIEEITENLE